MKLDAIKQEPNVRVQKYFERLDKLFQRGKIQDVERKRRILAKLRLEIRKLLGANVEVLPLTKVNLLQRMNSEALMQEATTILKNTHINDDYDWIPDQDSSVMTKEDDASTSNSDTGIDGSEHYDWESHQLKQIDCEDEFRDTKLEDLVRLEGPQEILQLILQEQVDEFMEEEITDVDDYADWLRWVSDAEQSRQAMYESTHDATIPLLLQQPNQGHTPTIPALLENPRFSRQKMVTLITALLINWHHPTMMK
jgi:hypothetical protein